MPVNPFYNIMHIERASFMDIETAQRFRNHFRSKPSNPIPVSGDGVTSVAQFMHITETHDKSVFFRGENRAYGRILASALRPHIQDPAKGIYPVKTLLSEFYKSTFTGLSANEKSNFLAFAQHHGIPTNLLDITANPLVALFFACTGADDEDGFVYLFTDYHIDITDLIDSHDITDSASFLSRLWADDTMRDAFSQRLHTFRRSHRIDGLLVKCAKMIALIHDVRGAKAVRKLLDTLHEQTISSKRGAWDADTIKTHKSWYKADALFTGTAFGDMCRKDEYLAIIDQYLPFIRNDTERIYPLLLSKTFQICINYAGHQETYELDFLPGILYRPLLSFGRAMRQVGAFFVQPYYYAGKTLFYQGMQSVKAVRISAGHKTSIRQALDRMDVNEGSIFGDYDHIASYVTGKHHK